ncbi:HIT family protein [Candidatus Woesearchaeota archaeon]|nr:HIT family protein [Candidatus Woesearchaeota archaeon]
MEDCIFCRIGRGKIPSHKIYEDKNSFAFLDIHPHAKGHAVVIPKIHAVTIFDLEEKQMQPLMLAVKKTMGLLQKKLQPDGFNVGWNSGAAGGQVVPHLHIHILPRYNGDGGGSIHSIIKNPREKDVEEVAKLFR